MTSTATAQTTHRTGDGFRIALGIGGLIAVVLGLLIMIFPGKTGAATMQIVAAITAAYALVVGVVYLGSAIFGKSVGGWARVGHIALGALYIVGGVVMMLNLGSTAVVLTVFLSVTVGVLWIFESVVSFVAAKHASSRVWAIIYGVIALLAGLALILSPLVGAVTLWILLGASMLVLGVVQVVRAIREK